MKTFNQFNNDFAACIPVAINESSLSRIWKHVTEHESGTISAFRYAADCGEGQVYSLSDNKKRNSILKSKLLAMGYGVTSINGVYIENYQSAKERHVKEQSFLVIDLGDSGNLHRDLIKLGTAFEQDSITFSKPDGDYFLISSNTCPNGYPGNGKIGVTNKLGKPMFGNKGEFHSTVNGRPFVFESAHNNCAVITDYPTASIRSIIEEAKSIIL